MYYQIYCRKKNMKKILKGEQISMEKIHENQGKNRKKCRQQLMKCG
jgi:hypothetical protein